MNTITNCFIGQLSDDYDMGHVVFSSYTNNIGYGIWTLTDKAEPDLTGIHHSGDPSLDVAAFDTIKGNYGLTNDYLSAPTGTEYYAHVVFYCLVR